MLALLLLIYIANLYVTGRLPKILLVAQAHGVAPSTIIWRVSTRRLPHKLHHEC